MSGLGAASVSGLALQAARVWWSPSQGRVAKPPPGRPGRHRLLASRHEVGHEGVVRVVVYGRPGRHVQPEILARLAVALGTLPSSAGLALEVVPVLEVAQGGLAGIHAEVDRASPPTVPAIRAATGDVGLPAERRRAGPAVTGVDPDLHPVQEHRRQYRTRGGPGRTWATAWRPRRWRG
jgi:hypothetical protein